MTYFLLWYILCIMESLAWWRIPVTTGGICTVSCLERTIHNLEEHSYFCYIVMLCDTGSIYCSRAGTHWGVWEVTGEYTNIWREELPAPRGPTTEICIPYLSGSYRTSASHQGYVSVLTLEQNQPIYYPNCPLCFWPTSVVLESWFSGVQKPFSLSFKCSDPTSLQILFLCIYSVARLSLHLPETAASGCFQIRRVCQLTVETTPGQRPCLTLRT